MAEGFDSMLNYQQIYGKNYHLLPNWDFQDEYTATNPIKELEAFPRCSTPIPTELKPQLLRNLPISTWLFVDKSYEEFKNGLKRLPDFVKVRGLKMVPQYLINGNIVTEERAKKLKKPTFKQLMQLNCDQLGQYVQDNHHKCQKKHSFNNKHQLSPKCQSTPSQLLPYEESELNEMYPHSPPRSLPPIPTQEYPSVLHLPNISNMVNDEDTPPFTEDGYEAMEYADWTKSDETDYLKPHDWSPDNNIGCKPEANMITPPTSDDNPSSGLPSRYEDLNLSDLLHRLRIKVKEDYMKKYKGTESLEKYEKYLYVYNTR